jgi:5'-3' exonuclease
MDGDQQQLLFPSQTPSQALAAGVGLFHSDDAHGTATNHREPVTVAVDGNSVVHRAWWAHQRGGYQDRDGNPMSASHGFLTTLGRVLRAVRATGVTPDRLIVGFDDMHSIRAQRWPDYKQGRAERDPDVTRQLQFIASELCALLGIAAVTAPGWEADDVCATVAANSDRCVVVSSDRDFYALITATTDFAKLGNGSVIDMITAAQFTQRFGFAAERYRDFAALRGDPSDNLRGVPGIGEKTASKVLSHATVSEILADPERFTAALGAPTVSKLLAGADAYTRNVAVMTMETDLGVAHDTGQLSAIDTRNALTMCADWGLKTAGHSFLDGLTSDIDPESF